MNANDDKELDTMMVDRRTDNKKDLHYVFCHTVQAERYLRAGHHPYGR